MSQYLIQGLSGSVLSVTADSVPALFEAVQATTGVPEACFRLSQGTKDVREGLEPGITVWMSIRLMGGKGGGFGTLLRGQGMIVRVDNFEDCRDLNGRRIRDVNNEIRLGEWEKRKREETQLTAISAPLDKPVSAPPRVPQAYRNEVKEATEAITDAVRAAARKRKAQSLAEDQTKKQAEKSTPDIRKKQVPDSNPASIRDRIQSLLREKETKQRASSAKGKKSVIAPRGTSATRSKDKSAGPTLRSTALYIATESAALVRDDRSMTSFTPKNPKNFKYQSEASTTKSLNRTFTFSAKKVNLKISQDKKEVVPIPSDSDSPRYRAAENSLSVDKETIVSILNSTVGSPVKSKERDLELTLRRTFNLPGLKLIRKDLGSRPPQTLLVVTGGECCLYDIILT